MSIPEVGALYRQSQPDFLATGEEIENRADE
jgi:hypothetical protein